MNYKGYAFVEDGAVVSVHYYESGVDTIALDEHPSVIAIPEQLFNIVLVGWQYADGEFTE